ncbi:MFS transporter [Caldisericum exile]|uniref:Major facilitator superfamily protein n=1 Tax=Caldisericum exile (strain DSM 21853 / NBRC 104410 / AZM16c01) TaxID=511051 RepID=A0A7U6GEU3_CALEA|nr:MFS transporter [Caldisericum exile]BAL81099.1 major facilitator superfamily protein [Caldisericum exile AZM16c01]
MEKRKNVLIFVLFGLITMLIGFNWFMWGPILKTFVEEGMGVKPVFAELLISAVPFLLVLFSYFAGAYSDRSPKRTTTIASLLLGIFTVLRALFSFNFTLLLLAHFGFALSATFAFTSWSPLTYRLFSKESASKITAYFTAFLVLGQIVAFFVSYPLASMLGIKIFLIITSLITLVTSVIYVLVIMDWDDSIRNVPLKKRLPLKDGFKLVFSNKSLVVLSLISFFDIGVFKWLAGWYPKLNVEFLGLDPTKASFINAFILIGCLLGAMTIPDLSHRIRKVKIFFIILPIVVILMIFLSMFINVFSLLLFESLILGIALFPIYPLGVHLPSAFSNVGIENAGIGSAIILIFANLGGTIFPLLGSLTKGFEISLLVFCIVPMVLIAILGLIFEDPDTYRLSTH